MKRLAQQRGVALFTAIFLIVVIAAVAAAFALTTTTQQLSSGRALDAAGAYAAANGRLDIAIAEVLAGDCDSVTDEDIHGYAIDLSCSSTGIQEGGDSYTIYELSVTASRGDRRSGTLVRRTLQAQVTDAD